jgi:ribosomal 50S subunit-recycling heat shock protein
MEQEFKLSLAISLPEDDGFEKFNNEAASEQRPLKVRLDKWLWAARFFKTRVIARIAVEKGNVLYNGKPSDPNREIEIGAQIDILHGRFEKTVTIKGLSTRRRSIPEALLLFEVQKTPSTQSAIKPSMTHSRLGNHQHDRSTIRFLRRTPAHNDRRRRNYSTPIEQPDFECIE